MCCPRGHPPFCNFHFYIFLKIHAGAEERYIFGELIPAPASIPSALRVAQDASPRGPFSFWIWRVASPVRGEVTEKRMPADGVHHGFRRRGNPGPGTSLLVAEREAPRIACRHGFAVRGVDRSSRALGKRCTGKRFCRACKVGNRKLRSLETRQEGKGGCA